MVSPLTIQKRLRALLRSRTIIGVIEEVIEYRFVHQMLNPTVLRSQPSWSLGIALTSAMTLTIAIPTYAIPTYANPHGNDRLEVAPKALEKATSASIPIAQNRSTVGRAPERAILTLGSEGEDVREFQAVLALLGYYSGEITGRFDLATAQAAQSFQASANLVTDGVVGPVTWGRLLPAPFDETPPAMSPESTGTGNTVPAPARVNFAERVNQDSSLPTVQLGSTNSSVSLLQQRLTAMGYYSGAIDGNFGPVTQAAVIEAQIDFGLLPNGIVDAAVWPYILN